MIPSWASLLCLVFVALSCAHTRSFVPSTPSSGASLNTRYSAPVVSTRQPQQRRSSVSCRESTLPYLDDPLLKPLEDDDYMAFGLACCFVMNENLKLDEYYVYEPLTAATLETIASSIELPTSYKRVTAFRAKDIFEGSPARPTGIQVEKLKILCQDEEGHARRFLMKWESFAIPSLKLTLCEDAVERALAAGRTFKRRVEAQVCGFGDVIDEFNFNTDRKRILNHKYEPSFDDNVKQDKSIDVYGRDEEAVNKQISDLENI